MTKQYLALFNTDSSYAEVRIEAESDTAALTVAKLCDQDELHFEAFTEPGPVQQIEIYTGCEAQDFLVGWTSDELRLRLVAPELLEAAKEVVARWGKGDLAEAVRCLADVIDDAEGN